MARSLTWVSMISLVLRQAEIAPLDIRPGVFLPVLLFQPPREIKLHALILHLLQGQKDVSLVRPR
jgi:hypothetical protein